MSTFRLLLALVLVSRHFDVGALKKLLNFYLQKLFSKSYAYPAYVLPNCTPRMYSQKLRLIDLQNELPEDIALTIFVYLPHRCVA